MKGRFVLDAWAVLALLQKEEPAASRVKRLLEDAQESNIELFISIINLGEVIYRIGKVKGEFYELIGSASLLPSEEIEQGSAINRSRAECIGDRLTLFVNGVKIDEVRDSELVTGEVGLIAGTYNEPGTDIRFDNFIVRQP